MKRELKQMVEEVLGDSPDTRNSDIKLTIEIWKRFYLDELTEMEGEEGINKLYVELDALYLIPREDCVKRWRAKFNEQGKYLPTVWEIAKKRGIKEDQWRLALGYLVKKDDNTNMEKNYENH